MPTLLEIQRAVRRNLVERRDAAAATHISTGGLTPEARLGVYRNTFIGATTTALRLSFPAVSRLVGDAFFESAVRPFIEATPPRSAYLNEYGGDFPAFLEEFEPADSLSYLPGVARLEWIVNRAFHAPDADPLDLSRLAAIDPGDHGRIVFTPEPSIGLLRAEHPVDDIWRAVLARDDAALAALDPGAGPVALLVQRRECSIQVQRMSDQAWCFMATLCARRPLQTAIDSTPGIDASILLAEHLAFGRFTDFAFADGNAAAGQQESHA